MAPGRRKGRAAATAAAGSRLKWKIGDLVLAKVKGFPPWPAVISEPQKWGYSSDRKKLFVFFFGTKQIAFCNHADVEAFTEEKRRLLAGKKFGKGADFSRAVDEIIDKYEKLTNYKINEEQCSYGDGESHLEHVDSFSINQSKQNSKIETLSSSNGLSETQFSHQSNDSDSSEKTPSTPMEYNTANKIMTRGNRNFQFSERESLQKAPTASSSQVYKMTMSKNRVNEVKSEDDDDDSYYLSEETIDDCMFGVNIAKREHLDVHNRHSDDSNSVEGNQTTNKDLAVDREFEMQRRFVVLKKKRKPNRRRSVQDAGKAGNHVQVMNSCNNLSEEHLPLVKRARSRMCNVSEEKRINNVPCDYNVTSTSDCRNNAIVLESALPPSKRFCRAFEASISVSSCGAPRDSGKSDGAFFLDLNPNTSGRIPSVVDSFIRPLIEKKSEEPSRENFLAFESIKSGARDKVIESSIIIEQSERNEEKPKNGTPRTPMDTSAFDSSLLNVMESMSKDKDGLDQQETADKRQLDTSVSGFALSSDSSSMKTLIDAALGEESLSPPVCPSNSDYAKHNLEEKSSSEVSPHNSQEETVGSSPFQSDISSDQPEKTPQKSLALLEASAARKSFESLLSSLSRTKESIGRATRVAIDCVKHGIGGEVVQILVHNLESTINPSRKLDLFFLVDSITQRSRVQKGVSGNPHNSLFQPVLSRLLLAAAPPGNNASDNRKQCVKVLKLWRDRGILLESAVQHHIRELESTNEDMLVDEIANSSPMEEEKSACTEWHNSFPAKHTCVLEDVDGELEMEDVSPQCPKIEISVFKDVPCSPPLPVDQPPSPPPLPSSPPPAPSKDSDVPPSRPFPSRNHLRQLDGSPQMQASSSPFHYQRSYRNPSLCGAVNEITAVSNAKGYRWQQPPSPGLSKFSRDFSEKHHSRFWRERSHSPPVHRRLQWNSEARGGNHSSDGCSRRPVNCEISERCGRFSSGSRSGPKFSEKAEGSPNGLPHGGPRTQVSSVTSGWSNGPRGSGYHFPFTASKPPLENKFSRFAGAPGYWRPM